jgi:hypothetical protein
MKRTHAVFVAVCLLVLSGSLLLRARAAAAPDTDTIRIWDNCDPVTFNAALGAGVCLPGPHGTEKFSLFVGEVSADRIAGAWRFGSTGYIIASGDSTALDNRGGETHTFTTVAKFGGGFVPFLNQLAGTPVPAPECLQPPSASNIFVEAGTVEIGPVAGSTVLPAGTTKVQCCVHPWMRTVINVK